MTTRPGEVLADVNFTLAEPAIVRGLVLGAGAGVEVRAVPADGRSHRYYVPTAQTLADGSFEIRFVSPGETMVQLAAWLDPADAPEGTTRTLTVKAGEEVDGVTLRSR